MRVKIFQARGRDEISALEGTINTWMDELSVRAEVKHMQTSLCEVPGGGGEQHLVVTLLYKLTN